MLNYSYINKIAHARQCSFATFPHVGKRLLLAGVTDFGPAYFTVGGGEAAGQVSETNDGFAGLNHARQGKGCVDLMPRGG